MHPAAFKSAACCSTHAWHCGTLALSGPHVDFNSISHVAGPGDGGDGGGGGGGEGEGEGGAGGGEGLGGGALQNASSSATVHPFTPSLCCSMHALHGAGLPWVDLHSASNFCSHVVVVVIVMSEICVCICILVCGTAATAHHAMLLKANTNSVEPFPRAIPVYCFPRCSASIDSLLC